MSNCTDREFMDTALDLAARGAGYVSPNPMVGAVVVNDGRIVGRGWHQFVGGPHAEVNALDDAGGMARGATLYVTLEPCNHHGRTPPCTEAILRAGISRVVVAMEDPNTDVRGGGNAFLKSRGVDVLCGVARERAERLNECFIKYMRTRRPFVVLKTAATLDGRIATRTGDARWVTGPQARAHVHRMRLALDGIMVGIGTVLADDPHLTARVQGHDGVDPVRFVLDTHLKMPETVIMLSQASSAPTYVVCAAGAPDEAKHRLGRAGARFLEVPVEKGRLDLRALMRILGGMTITSLLIEGGSRVAAGALAAGIVDKIAFFYAPKLLGGDDGVPVCAGPGPELMAQALNVADISVTRLGRDILVEGYI